MAAPKPYKKQCNECGKFKTRDNFYRLSRSRDGFGYKCKPCAKRVTKLRYENKKKEIQAQTRAWYQSLRLAAEYIYGGRCASCGTTDNLEFDHVNGDGAEHRRTESLYRMLRRITETGKLKDCELQLLCKECHLNKA